MKHPLKKMLLSMLSGLFLCSFTTYSSEEYNKEEFDANVAKLSPTLDQEEAGIDPL